MCACVCVCVCLSQAHGYMYVFADMPIGTSYARQKVLGKVGLNSARSYPIKKFYNNVAHSYKRVGYFFGLSSVVNDNVDLYSAHSFHIIIERFARSWRFPPRFNSVYAVF